MYASPPAKRMKGATDPLGVLHCDELRMALPPLAADYDLRSSAAANPWGQLPRAGRASMSVAWSVTTTRPPTLLTPRRRSYTSACTQQPLSRLDPARIESVRYLAQRWCPGALDLPDDRRHVGCVLIGGGSFGAPRGGLASCRSRVRILVPQPDTHAADFALKISMILAARRQR